MSDKASRSFDLEAFEKATAGRVDRAQSLEEIEAWLKSQQNVKSVHLTNYLLKSNPPQRDFVVVLQTSDETMITRSSTFSIWVTINFDSINCETSRVNLLQLLLSIYLGRIFPGGMYGFMYRPQINVSQIVLDITC